MRALRAGLRPDVPTGVPMDVRRSGYGACSLGHQVLLELVQRRAVLAAALCATRTPWVVPGIRVEDETPLYPSTYLELATPGRGPEDRPADFTLTAPPEESIPAAAFADEHRLHAGERGSIDQVVAEVGGQHAALATAGLPSYLTHQFRARDRIRVVSALEPPSHAFQGVSD